MSSAAGAVDGGELPLGGGLLAIVRPALDLLGPGGVLSVLSSHPAAGDDLAAWCRVERHEYLGADGVGGDRRAHRIRRGTLGVAKPFGPAMPARADATTGFAPLGSRVEPGGPAYPFTLLERDRVAPPESRALYDQATASQWSADRDIPWASVKPLPPALEAAVGQIMGFLAENELSALYVPSAFLPRIHPAYADAALFLATQLNDEARHIDVFLRRSRAGGGGPGVSTVTTAQSLLSLLELGDFTEAAFLLSVLGEGTFLDLLKYVERHAPDEATALLAQKARADETRHVHFGMAHVRHALGADASLYGRLEAAVRRRAATLHGAGGVPGPIADALTILAAGGSDPRGVRKGHEAYRELLETMGENRVKRLETAGFTAEQARTLSDLHTPNFM
jgi:hypothetical protein